MSKLNYNVYSNSTECNIHTATGIIVYNLGVLGDGTKTASIEIQGRDRDDSFERYRISFEYELLGTTLKIEELKKLINETIAKHMLEDEWCIVQFNANSWENEIADIISSIYTTTTDLTISEETLAKLRYQMTNVNKNTVTLVGNMNVADIKFREKFSSFSLDLIERKLKVYLKSSYDWVDAEIDHEKYISSVLTSEQIDNLLKFKELNLLK